MTEHTPGPWKWVEIGIEEEEALVPEAYSKDNPTDVVLTLGWVCLVDGSRGTEPSPEDARLIAAAPAMLDALRDIQKKLYSVLKHVDNEYALGSLYDAESTATRAIRNASKRGISG